jgi:hypothetical protein
VRPLPKERCKALLRLFSKERCCNPLRSERETEWARLFPVPLLEERETEWVRCEFFPSRQGERQVPSPALRATSPQGEV